MTTNGESLLPFKRGDFDIDAPMKMTNIKYKSKYFDPNMNFVTVPNFFFLKCITIEIYNSFNRN